jgi:nucleoside-diphosphate-sugar epimerase
MMSRRLPLVERGGSMEWRGTNVLVTGGTSFIGSSLVDALVTRRARVRVVDNLSSGRLDTIDQHVKSRAVEFIQGDLLDPTVAARAVAGMTVVFHLAADHGGRGYVDLHNVECSTNLILDGHLFREAARARVEKVVYASSGCVYPNFRQTNPKEELYLTEDLVGPPYDADNMYGWAKLMGEFTLAHYATRGLLRGASCRYFTVYGPRGKEDHAVIAMIARAFTKQNPFEVWGTGEQIRNWTYIDDIVEGTIRSAERIDDGTAVNLGTMERIRVVDAAKMILERMGVDVPLKFRPEMPTGPYNRVASNRLAQTLLAWEPQTPFREGVGRTIEWYIKNRNRTEVQRKLETMLTER